jgi:hypothetical protein
MVVLRHKNKIISLFIQIIFDYIVRIRKNTLFNNNLLDEDLFLSFPFHMYQHPIQGYFDFHTLHLIHTLYIDIPFSDKT